jgi:hypothetical protein
MATTLLRKLSWKSQMKFGEYADMTVQMVFDLGENEKQRLAWYYYNSSMISYLDDVLDALGIVGDLRIDKPSKEHGLFRKWIAIRKEHWTDEQRMSVANKRTGLQNRRRKQGNKLSNSHYTGRALQLKNHGH